MKLTNKLINATFIVLSGLSLLSANQTNADEAYAHVYNLKSLILGEKENVTFDSNGLMDGIQHETGSDQITFKTNGTYFIQFITVAESPSSFALFLNDKLVKGSIYGSGKDIGHSLTGQVIANVKDGDVLTLKNYNPLWGGTAKLIVDQQGTGGSAPTMINASINVIQID